MTPTTPYFVYTPNPFVCDGQSIIPCDLKPGESLKGFLLRHAPHLTEDGWAVSIGGAEVAPAMWGKTFPKEGMHIACRAVLGRQVVQLVAVAALTYFTLGFGAATAGMWGAGAVAGSIGALGALGVYMAGSILINKVLGPKVPKLGETAAAKQVYSLSSQRNSARAYEPIGTLWGEMRVTPDMASQPYTWYEGDDQYLSTILLGGVNVHSVSDLSIGDTPITSYQDVSVYYNGFAGMQSQSLPLYSNADSLVGGELENNGAWVTRTSSAGGIALQVDIEGQLFDVDNKGGILVNTVPLFIESRPVGGAWAPAHSETLSNASTAVLRRTITLPVAAGQHEVRVRLGQPRYNEGDGKDTCKLAWTVLKSIQADTTDYTSFGRIGIKIKATGQFSGSVDTLHATYRAKPMPIWTGTAWATATTRENGLSNPGAIILQTLRGVKHNGKLQFGFGMADEDIDIEGLKAFMLHCAANDYTYDRWVTSEISLMEFCDEVARAGMGEFAWTDGSRPTAMFVAPGQPTSAVVNMANMAKASFSVDYAVASTADGIEYQYVDRARKFETSTIRVNAPGVTTPLNPARITGEGVTTEAHAAKMARFHLGQSLYQYKTINFGANIEHLDYRRLSVLSVSHDLTQWGFGGRVQEVVVGQGFINVRLDEPVPPLATRKLGLRLPGERDYRVWDVTPFTDSQEVLTLVGDWPLEERVPGDGDDNPAHDTLWCYDFKATPGYRVRVVNVEPEKDLSGADITCVPEGPEFWDYVLNGTYVPAPSPSALPQLARPSVQNVRVTEQTNIQGNTRWWQLSAVWESQGAAEYCQVWAGLDGSMLTLVDARATGNRSSWRIEEPGEYLIQVRPFDASGRAGDAISVVYVTYGVAVPPVNASNFVVQELAGGLRRFAWSFAGDTPVAFAGVQIRYVAGDTQVSAASWDELTPLGDADDIYTAQFETTKPPAGLYTFALRTINTSGQLSANVLRFAVNLSDSFEQIQQVDLTPPPTPTGFTVGAGISYLFIGCDPQTYSQGRGHLVTRLYGATWTTGDLPVFADATVLAEFQGTVFSHPTNPATTWHLWITWVTRDGVESLTPAGGTNGLPVTTGQDVSSLLDALTGQITQSQLYGDLGARIDLIDGSGAGSVNARLSTEASTRATQTGELYAKYTVKVDVAGLISGYGLASTANNAAPTSSFGVRANAFFVAPPAVASATAPTTDLYDGYVWLDTSVVPNVTRYRSGSSWVLNAPALPFVVQSTPTTVNGVAVPAGVYANDLFVKNGTITNAKIANLAVDNAKIANLSVDNAKIANLSVSKLTAGSLAVGQYVQSTNYVPNVSGWQWRADGSAELGSQYIRGKLTAAQIDTRGLDIRDASGNVILSSGTSLKSQIAGNLPGGVTSNLLDTSGWVVNQHGGTPGFQPNGGYFEQWHRAISLPDGSIGTTWFCYPGLYYNNAYGWDNPRPEGVPAGDADGGWNTDTFPINNNRGYRFAVWFRREGGAVGSVYLGCQAGTVYDMPGTAINTNPYFVVVPLANLVVGRWYLAVGYIYPTSESAAGQRGQSGLYDGTTGQKVHGGTDYTWAAGATTGIHRAYLYYSAAGSHLEMVWPRVEMTTGAEPSLAELLSMGSISARNPITAGNASTYISNLAVTHLQLAGGAVSVHNVLGFSGGTGTLATGTIGMPANGVLEFAGGYRLSAPAEFYSASQRAAFNCNITVVVYKNGTHIGTIAAYGSVVNGPWVGFNQQYGSSVGDFTGKISGAINVAATISDVFSFRVDCSSTINISGSLYNAGYCFEGVLRVSGVYK